MHVVDYCPNNNAVLISMEQWIFVRLWIITHAADLMKCISFYSLQLLVLDPALFSIVHFLSFWESTAGPKALVPETDVNPVVPLNPAPANKPQTFSRTKAQHSADDICKLIFYVPQV